MRIGKRYSSILVLVIITALVFSGCASKQDMHQEAPTEEAKSYDQESVGFNNSKAKSLADNEMMNDDTSVDALEGRKVIKSGQIDLETREFDKTVNAIITKTNFIGGYVESSDISGRGINEEGELLNRSSRLSLRIPEKEFENFMLDINTLGSVTNSITAGKDITSQYFDTEAHLKSLSIQEERLLEILKKAEKVEDIIELEKELARIRYEIESLTGTLKKWDNLVSYSTLEISIYEVHEVTEVRKNPRTLGSRMGDGFKDSVEVVIDMIKGLLVFIASLIPFAVIIVPLGLVVLLILKRKVKTESKNNKINKE